MLHNNAGLWIQQAWGVRLDSVGWIQQAGFSRLDSAGWIQQTGFSRLDSAGWGVGRRGAVLVPPAAWAQEEPAEELFCCSGGAEMTVVGEEVWSVGRAVEGGREEERERESDGVEENIIRCTF